MKSNLTARTVIIVATILICIVGIIGIGIAWIISRSTQLVESQE